MTKIIPFIIMIILSACSMAPDLKNHEPDLPKQFTKTKVILTKDSLINIEWWKQFKDPRLNVIIDSVIARNLDLNIMIERVKQIEAIVGIQSSQYWYPQLNMNAGYSDSKQNMLNNFIPNGPEYFSINNKTYSLSGTFILNLDFWGKLKNMRNSALSDWMAMKYDLKRFYQNIIAQVVSNYFDIITLRQELSSDKKLSEDLDNEEQIQERKYRSGIRSKYNLELARQGSASQKLKVKSKEVMLKSMELQLAYLLGGAQLNMKLAEKLPDTKLEFYKSVSSELAKKRADVQAAFQRMESARYKVGVARADFFPQLSITANAGWSTKSATDIFNMDLLNKSWGINIVQGIFNGFVNQSNLDKSWAEFAIAVKTYQKTVLTAFHDIEKSLFQLERSYEQFNAQVKMFNAGKNVLRITEKRYLRGVSDYKQLIDTRLSFSQIESSRLQQKKRHLLSGVQLYLALGGNWIKKAE